jgi:hypothetical protein
VDDRDAQGWRNVQSVGGATPLGAYDNAIILA